MLRFSANISLLFKELPLPERFAAARMAGFSAVEIQNPYEHSAASLTQAARAADVRVVLINAPMGEDPSTLGTASLPIASAAQRQHLERAAEFAQALESPFVNVLAGRASPDDAAAIERLTQTLSLAAQLLGGVNARPLLEVINPITAPGYCITDFTRACKVLDAADPRVALQFDVFHAGMLGLDPATEFTRLLPRIGHVQFADMPGRHEPGTGTLDFPRIFATIRNSAYQGWVGAEYHPCAATAEGLKWLHGPR